jgi:hypothetical protein
MLPDSFLELYRVDEKLLYTYLTHHGKVKWSRYTQWRRLGWDEVWLQLILNLGAKWGWVVSVTPRPRFTPGTHWTGGWVGPRADLDADAKGKILCLCRGSNPDRPVRTMWICMYTPYTMTPQMLRRMSHGTWRRIRLCFEQDSVHTDPLDVQRLSPHGKLRGYGDFSVTLHDVRSQMSQF